jgi:hypothetical protein
MRILREALFGRADSNRCQQLRAAPACHDGIEFEVLL